MNPYLDIAPEVRKALEEIDDLLETQDRGAYKLGDIAKLPE